MKSSRLLKDDYDSFESWFLSTHKGKSVSIHTIIDSSKDEFSFNEVMQSILNLESKSLIYIERNPRVESGILRTDISKQDTVYVDSFPSIRRKSLLYRTGVEYGDFTINHLQGCAHGCTYPCYSFMISRRYGRVTGYEDWMRPRLVENALELLDIEIPKYKERINFVHLSFMTDPFMYDAVNKRNIPQVQEMTLNILKKLNNHSLKSTILTKGIYPATLSDNEYNPENEYGITLVSLDRPFHQQYETYSSPPMKRIEALRNLHDVGLKTWASLEPYPTPNIVDQNLADIIDSVDFVDKIIFGKWNYNAEISKYKDSERFYIESSDSVIEFCKQRGIPYHIKKHTPRSEKSTEGLFVR